MPCFGKIGVTIRSREVRQEAIQKKKKKKNWVSEWVPPVPKSSLELGAMHKTD